METGSGGASFRSLEAGTRGGVGERVREKGDAGTSDHHGVILHQLDSFVKGTGPTLLFLLGVDR